MSAVSEALTCAYGYFKIAGEAARDVRLSSWSITAM
jgi:hypothetical protein